MRNDFVSVLLFSSRTKVELERLVRFVDGHSDIVQVPSLPPDPELGEQSDGEHHQGGLRNRLCNTGPGEYYSLLNILVSNLLTCCHSQKEELRNSLWKIIPQSTSRA